MKEVPAANSSLGKGRRKNTKDKPNVNHNNVDNVSSLKHDQKNGMVILLICQIIFVLTISKKVKFYFFKKFSVVLNYFLTSYRLLNKNILRSNLYSLMHMIFLFLIKNRLVSKTLINMY